MNSIFKSQDIGSPKIIGSAKQTSRGWDLIAGGVDIWERTDQFHFLYQELSGDFDVAVRVDHFSPAHLYSKAGLMIRESLDADSPHLMQVVFSSNEPRNNNLGAYELQYRGRAGEECQAIYPQVLPPSPPEFPATFPNTWLRVVRKENHFSAYGSQDGNHWRIYGETELVLSSDLLVGIALTSHNADSSATASFCDYRCV